MAVWIEGLFLNQLLQIFLFVIGGYSVRSQLKAFDIQIDTGCWLCLRAKYLKNMQIIPNRI